MTNAYSIAKLIDEIDEHPLRWEVITLESAMSLPTLRQNEGKLFVEFYFYPSGGPIDNRQIWPPYYRAISQVNDRYRVDLIPIDPQELGSISTEQSLGSGYLNIRSRDEYEAQLNNLCDLFEQLINFYPKSRSELSTSAREVVAEFRSLFYALTQASLIPSYKVLNLYFFNWIDEVRE
jgi:hypothetical protein